MFKIMVDFQGMYVLPLEVQNCKKVHVSWMCELKILIRIMVFTKNTDKITVDLESQSDMFPGLRFFSGIPN